MYTIERRIGYQWISLPQYFWHGREPVELNFPETWDVSVCSMSGDGFPVLSSAEIREKILMPIGVKRLRELATGRKEVAIVIDDTTRPTEGRHLIPHILGELTEAGIPDGSIRFLIALGCHGAHTTADFRKKLGPGIVERFGVYNHNCYENCVEVGKTRSGLAVKVNAELIRCDLKIGVGSILPHIYVGYSGGGKLFVPGMAHIDTIHDFHSFLTPDRMGQAECENAMVREIEDAVELIGVDYIVNTLVNTQGEVIDLVAGDTLLAYGEGIRKAMEIYRTSSPEGGFDICVSNAHIKANEGDIALLVGLNAIKPSGGTCVLILNSPEGQMTHYLMRWFGKFIGGRQSVTRLKLPEQTNIIVYSQYKDTTTFDPIENQEMIIWEKDWSQVVQELQKRHGDDGVKVGIIPDGTIQHVTKGEN